MNILEVAKVMVSASQTWCWDSPHVGQNRSAHPSVGIQPTYISEVQCSSACEKEAERADHLARVDRLAWQTSINTTWGSGSHCNEQQRVRSWDVGQLLQGRYKDIWYGRQSAKCGQISNLINSMLVKNLPRILSVATVHSQPLTQQKWYCTRYMCEWRNKTGES